MKKSTRESIAELMKVNFEKFCQETSLHGWQYLSLGNRKIWHKAFWLILILSSNILSITVFLKSYNDFMTAKPTTNIDTTTSSLEDVTFPMITICNNNQLRKSFLNEIGLDPRDSKTLKVFTEYMFSGFSDNLTKEEEENIKKILVRYYYY